MSPVVNTNPSLPFPCCFCWIDFSFSGLYYFWIPELNSSCLVLHVYALSSLIISCTLVLIPLLLQSNMFWIIDCFCTNPLCFSILFYLCGQGEEGEGQEKHNRKELKRLIYLYQQQKRGSKWFVTAEKKGGKQHKTKERKTAKTAWKERFSGR